MAIGALENIVSTSYELEELVSIIIDETSGTSPSLTTAVQVERRTVVDKVVTSSSSQILPTFQTFMQSNNINIMDPSTNPGNFNRMNMMSQSQCE